MLSPSPHQHWPSATATDAGQTVVDHVKFDEALLVAAALGDLEAPHVRVLALVNGASGTEWNRPGSRRVESLENFANEAGGALVLPAITAALVRHGLIEMVEGMAAVNRRMQPHPDSARTAPVGDTRVAAADSRFLRRPPKSAFPAGRAHEPHLRSFHIHRCPRLPLFRGTSSDHQCPHRQHGDSLASTANLRVDACLPAAQGQSPADATGGLVKVDGAEAVRV